MFLSSALGPVSTIQSGTFSGKVVTAYLPSSSDASHPPFSAIAAAAPGQLFPIALQIELHYQCRYIIVFSPLNVCQPSSGAPFDQRSFLPSSSSFGSCRCSVFFLLVSTSVTMQPAISSMQCLVAVQVPLIVAAAALATTAAAILLFKKQRAQTAMLTATSYTFLLSARRHLFPIPH